MTTSFPKKKLQLHAKDFLTWVNNLRSVTQILGERKGYCDELSSSSDIKHLDFPQAKEKCGGPVKRGKAKELTPRVWSWLTTYFYKRVR